MSFPSSMVMEEEKASGVAEEKGSGARVIRNLVATAILIGLSVLTVDMPKKKDRDVLPPAGERPERGYPLDRLAVPSSKLPARFNNGGVVYVDADLDGDLESIYAWENPDGNWTIMPMVRGNGGSIEFPTLSKSSLSPLKINRRDSRRTYFTDADRDGDVDAFYFDYSSNAIPEIKFLYKPQPEETTRPSYKI